MFPSAHPWLHRCPQCGLGMCNPQPSDAELAEIYNADYYAQFGHGSSSAEAGLARIKRDTYVRFLRQAEKLIAADQAQTENRLSRAGQVSTRPSHGHRPRLLDIGCGLGYSLLGGQARGWDVAGLEPHGLAGAGLPRELACRIIRGRLDNLDASDRPADVSLRDFDLVSMIDVIEHVRDPVATVRQAAKLLRPGGVLMVATNSLASRGARSPGWVHFHRAHLWYFSPATLSAVVAAAGIKVRSVATAWRVYNLQYVASILAGGDNSPTRRLLARAALKIVPRPLRLMSWPPLAEGMLLLASQ